MNRRGLLGGLITALAAPAIIRTPGVLMAVKPIVVGDGVALFSALHPYDERFSNRLTDAHDLTEESLRNAIVLIREFKDQAGRRVFPVVSPMWFTANSAWSVRF